MHRVLLVGPSAHAVDPLWASGRMNMPRKRNDTCMHAEMVRVPSWPSGVTKGYISMYTPWCHDILGLNAALGGFAIESKLA